jgi:hypothetical protein
MKDKIERPSRILKEEVRKVMRSRQFFVGAWRSWGRDRIKREVTRLHGRDDVADVTLLIPAGTVLMDKFSTGAPR